MAPKAASSGIAVSECVKHTVQTIKLLDERSLSFSFCFNKTDTMVIAFFTLLYLSLDVHPDSKMMKALGRVTSEVLEMLIRHNITGILPLQQAASQLVPLRSMTARASSRPPSPATIPKTTQPRAGASQLSPKSIKQRTANGAKTMAQQNRQRRVTMSNDNDAQHKVEPAMRNSLDLGSFENPLVESPEHTTGAVVPKTVRSASARTARPGLDYLSFEATSMDVVPNTAGSDAMPTHNAAPNQQAFLGTDLQAKPKQRADVSVSEWEAILGAMDGGSIYHAIYGGGPSLSPGDMPSSNSNTGPAWSPDGWDLSGFQINNDMTAGQTADDFANTDMFAGITTDDFHMHATSHGLDDPSSTRMDTDTSASWSYTDPWNAPPSAGGH